MISAFKENGNLIVYEIHDVMVVPNYRKIFNDLESNREFNIPTLLRHLLDTKHTWKFLAIDPHPGHFPLGVKVVYKAYCCNKVVEFEKIPKEFCASAIGYYTLTPGNLEKKRKMFIRKMFTRAYSFAIFAYTF